MQLLDNITQLLGDDLKRTLTPGAKLRIAASCFSIYAYEALKAELEQVESVEFIFTSPTFLPNEVSDKLRKEHREFHIPIYDYVFTDSTVERKFVDDLDASTEVVVYAKLPKTFFIPTPVGNYNPDWAIAFKQGAVKHVYFIAETKGSLDSLQLRDIEKSKIACARKFFAKITNDQVRYEVVDGYGKLMDMVGAA